MMDLFGKIVRCEEDLEDIAAFTASLHNHSVNKPEEQQKKDINTCNKVYLDYLKEKHTHLENLQLEIEKEKHKISQLQKSFTLKIAQ